MRTAGMLIFGFQMCLWGIPARAADPPGCALKQIASIQLVTNAHGRLLVPVTIEGTSAFMSLHTENWFSTVREGEAQRLGLKIQDGPIRIGGPLKSHTAPIQKMAISTSFALGPQAHFKKAEFVVVRDYPDSDETIGGLGNDFLANLDVELDLANHKMNLFNPDHCPGKVVYWANEYTSIPIVFGPSGQMFFPMELEGKPVEAILATGTETTTLPTDVTRLLFGFDSSSRGVEARSDPDGRESHHYRAMDVTSQGFRIVNADIRLEEPSAAHCRLYKRAGAWGYENCIPGHPLRLGRNVIAKLHMYIAVKEKVLYFTAAQTSTSDAVKP